VKRKRRRPEQQSANHDRWLVSYADFITLLFAFFVVLYATAQTDNKKVARVAAAIKGAFQQLGVFTGSGLETGMIPPKIIFVQGSGGANAQIVANTSGPIATIEASGMNVNATQSPLGSGSPGVDTEKLKHELETALGDDIRKQRVQMRVGPDGLVVSLREIGFFDSGAASLLPEAKPTLTRLAKVLEEKNFEIRVEGHTDNVPIHTQQFNSNWELSTARATEVVSMLVREYGFDPRYVSVAGYAEYRPLYSNDTEEGRKANRRIDLVVIGMRKPTAQLIPDAGLPKPR
jgi:chemotaxis protein MotB